MDMKYYTSKELAKILGVSTITIKREYERGKLNGFLVGNELRCSQADIDEYTNFRRYGKTSREIALEREVEKLSKETERLKSIMKSIGAAVLQMDIL